MRMFGRTDEDDDRVADTISRGVESMSDHNTLVRFIWITGAINTLIWASVLIVPADVRDGFERVWTLNQKIDIIVLGLVFGLGMLLTYALFRLKFPDLEEQRLDADVMGSFAYQSDATKRFRVWLFSAIGGVVNVLLLILAVIIRT